ncbi:hypothetical protein [Lacrimispora xylanisolvens]|uniref:hypothetical protein n=1 Tax=Lacrimispora xylanisolvens TaxID=384636 RepID=UPI002402821F
MQAIYEQKEEPESGQIREALTKYEQQINKEAQFLCLKTDYDVHLNEVRSIAESEIEEIMDMDFEPASFPEEAEEISSDGWMGKAITELADAEAIFQDVLQVRALVCRWQELTKKSLPWLYVCQKRSAGV